MFNVYMQPYGFMTDLLSFSTLLFQLCLINWLFMLEYIDLITKERKKPPICAKDLLQRRDSSGLPKKLIPVVYTCSLAAGNEVRPVFLRSNLFNTATERSEHSLHSSTCLEEKIEWH